MSRKTHGQVRRSQVITTYGPGALIDLPRHSAIVGDRVGCQEKAYGGLSTAVRMRLSELAGQLASAKPVPTRVPPGTRLIRQWREERHEVTVLERGYVYRGSRYTSLSVIACLISGSHCPARASLA